MEWISVKDRLPEKGERVLVTLLGGARLVAWLDDWAYIERLGWVRGHSAADILDDVAYWMQLPKPPKKESPIDG